MPATEIGRGNLGLGPALIVYVISACALDLQFPLAQVNLGNIVLVAGCALAVAYASVARMRAGIIGVSLLSQDWVYGAYIAFVALSTLYSPGPINTAVQAFYLGVVWVASINLADGHLQTLNKTVIWAAFIVALLSFAVVPLSGEVAFQPSASTSIPELRGIFSHQLRLGVFMAVAVGMIGIAYLNGELQDLLRERLWAIVVIAVIVTCLLAAFARLYTAAMVLSFVLTIGLSKPGALRRFTVMGLVLCCAAVIVLRGPLLQFVINSGVDITMTGRTILWERTLTFSAAHPWIGHGYASFDNPQFDALFGRYRPAHPHNSYLQAYFETGYIGLALTLLLVMLQLRVALRVSRFTGKYSYSLFLVLLTVLGSITGSNYAGKPTLLFSLLLLVVAIESRQVRRAARNCVREGADVSRPVWSGYRASDFPGHPAGISWWGPGDRRNGDGELNVVG